MLTTDGGLSDGGSEAPAAFALTGVADKKSATTSGGAGLLRKRLNAGVVRNGAILNAGVEPIGDPDRVDESLEFDPAMEKAGPAGPAFHFGAADRT